MTARGFTLIEVLVATGVVCVTTLGGIQLVAIATRAMAEARAESLSAALAAARMEQLRGLRFEFDAAGLRVMDVTTDLSTDPPAPGGSGLTPSGSGALDVNTPGFADFLDGSGRWLGGGSSPPAGTVFVRRWSIEAADAGGDLLVVQVLVRRLAAGAPPPGGRAAGEARYASLLVRVRR